MLALVVKRDTYSREKDEIRLDTAFGRIRIGVSVFGLFVLSITVRVF